MVFVGHQSKVTEHLDLTIASDEVANDLDVQVLILDVPNDATAADVREVDEEDVDQVVVFFVIHHDPSVEVMSRVDLLVQDQKHSPLIVNHYSLLLVSMLRKILVHSTQLQVSAMLPVWV